MLGSEGSWPRELTNFVEGVRAGRFRAPPGMPGPTADALRQTALQVASTATQVGPAFFRHPIFETYRGFFNSLWDSAPFAALSASFDPALDSRGPRTTSASGPATPQTAGASSVPSCRIHGRVAA